jgi:hypothetical protein
MCWNEAVSLNTFLVSLFTLCIVYYNNHYTKYKNSFFDNKWMYIFLLLSFSMQFIEFFIWRNINHKYYNHIFTICAFIIIYLQPIASLMLISNHSIRNIGVIIYSLIGGIYVIYTIYMNTFLSTVSKNGHLQWNININHSLFWIWLVFLLFSFLYEKRYSYLIIGLITLFIFIYKETSSSGSVWCWFINSLSIYLLIYLVFYLPYCEKKKIC